MPRRRRGEPPRLCHHKASNQGYVFIEGKCIYLGTFGTPECRQRYRAELLRWEEEQKGERVERKVYLGRGATIAELVEAFMREVADVKFQIDGEKTTSWKACRLFLRDDLAARFGDMRADEFRHPEFEEYRQKYIQKGYARGSMKNVIARILVLFRWGHKKGVVSAETLTSLATSPEPDEGEERDPVGHVEPATLAKLLEFLKQPSAKCDYPARRQRLSAMMEIQYLVGMRPGELVRMKSSEIRQDATVLVKGKTIQIFDEAGKPYAGWVFQPGRHKNLKRGRYLAYLIGPKARALLEPYLPQNSEAYLWQGRLARTHLTYEAYQKIVREVCVRAGLPHIAVNQLRHGAATRYGLIAGIESASNVLNHASLDTTAIYFSRNLQSVTGLVEKHG